jgi:hypothetical protein
MKPPRIPPLLTDIIQTGISACDGLVFTAHSECPFCGGPLSGYDTKKKQFACLLCDGEPKKLYVHVKRFYCRTCRKISCADEPFYPDTRIGSVIIDLCIALSLTIPVNRVPAYLAALGISMNRSSCRLYIRNNSNNYVLNNVRYMEPDTLFGVHLPHSVVSLSALANNTVDGSPVAENQILKACGYPSAQRRSMNCRSLPKPWESVLDEEPDDGRQATLHQNAPASDKDGKKIPDPSPFGLSTGIR